MTGMTISFRADEQTVAELREIAGDRPEIEMDGTLTRVLIDQLRAVDASRLGDFAGRLDAAEVGEVDRAVRLILGVL